MSVFGSPWSFSSEKARYQSIWLWAHAAANETLVAGSSRSSLRMNSSSLNEITHGHAAAFLVCYNYHSLYDSRVQRPHFGILVTQNCHEQCFPFLLARLAIERKLIFGHDVGHGRAKSVKGCIPDYVARIVDLPPSHVLTSGNIFWIQECLSRRNRLWHCDWSGWGNLRR